MKARIQEKARELGFDSCRFTTAAPPEHAAAFTRWIDQQQHGEMQYLARNAAKRIDPALVLREAKSVIVLASSYAPDASTQHPSSPSGPRGIVARYAQYRDYHDILNERLELLTAFLQTFGQPHARSLWYVDTGPILERDLAQRAGLGFVGKHTNLISRTLGNWFFISEILTTLEIEPDLPERNRCGSCTRCLTACPTGALTAPFQLDARLCISYLTIELKGAIPEPLRPLIGNRVYGCDDCLAACPWNRFAQAGKLLLEHARADLRELDLIALLQLDEAQFRQRFAGTPLIRTKRRGLLRNACVALGNVGTPDALPHLEKAALDCEPLIAEHARWAIAQIRSRLAPPRQTPLSRPSASTANAPKKA